MAGYYRLPRGLFKLPIFSGKDKHLRYYAFIWLVERAVFKPYIIENSGIPHELQTGQLSLSLREAGAIWGCSYDKASSILKTFEKFGLIKLDHLPVVRVLANNTEKPTKITTKKTLITILDYNRFKLGASVTSDKFGDKTSDKPQTQYQQTPHIEEGISKEGSNEVTKYSSNTNPLGITITTYLEEIGYPEKWFSWLDYEYGCEEEQSQDILISFKDYWSVEKAGAIKSRDAWDAAWRHWCRKLKGY
jgi:hypothetical protein